MLTFDSLYDPLRHPPGKQIHTEYVAGLNINLWKVNQSKKKPNSKPEKSILRRCNRKNFLNFFFFLAYITNWLAIKMTG